MPLVEINEKKYPIVLDLRYATTNNFTRQQIYQKPLCLLHSQAIPLFEKAIQLAEQQNFRFKIFDAFRPQAAQEKLWSIFPDPTYVMDPLKGSNHTRGIAIDLTLVDQHDQELDMGTPFDDFTSKSHHIGEVSAEVNSNRYKLLGIMMSAGWDLYRYEWWHYQLLNVDSFPLLENDWGIMSC